MATKKKSTTKKSTTKKSTSKSNNTKSSKTTTDNTKKDDATTKTSTGASVNQPKVEEEDASSNTALGKQIATDNAKVEGKYSDRTNPFKDNNVATTPSNVSAREATIDTMHVGLDVPIWGYKDFINERIAWQKGTRTMYDDPAWFYFKIFFKFDTSFGLLGGVYDTSTTGAKGIQAIGAGTTNTAMKYLITLKQDRKYRNYINGRLDSLYKFICTLSYISSNAPWFFNAVHDVNNALTTDFNDITKKKSIVIDCLQESVDMKLMTLMDYYKFACFDDVQQREIIPENLRKFDMDIVVFQGPLRYLHTSSQDMEGRKSNYKNMYSLSSSFKDLMSYKLFTFKNCEFDYESLNGMLPSEFNNGEGFNSKPTIKINYDRVYQHNSNEFARTFVGDSGMLYNFDSIEQNNNNALDDYTTYMSYTDTSGADWSNYYSKDGPSVVGSPTTGWDNRQKQLIYMHEHPNYYNINSNMYKALVEATEAQVTNYMRLVDGSTGLGNLYGDYSSLAHAVKDTAKNLANSVTNQYKNMGKSFAKSWKMW